MQTLLQQFHRKSVSFASLMLFGSRVVGLLTLLVGVACACAGTVLSVVCGAQPAGCHSLQQLHGFAEEAVPMRRVGAVRVAAAPRGARKTRLDSEVWKRRVALQRALVDDADELRDAELAREEQRRNRVDVQQLAQRDVHELRRIKRRHARMCEQAHSARCVDADAAAHRARNAPRDGRRGVQLPQRGRHGEQTKEEATQISMSKEKKKARKETNTDLPQREDHLRERG